MSELTDYSELRENPSKFVESILGVSCFDYQKKFLDADARHRVVSSGRQVGKSRMAAWLALHHAMTHAHEQVLITAPSLRQSSLLFKTLYSEIDQSGMSDDAWGIERDTQTIIEFDNGSSIHCLPTGRNGNKIRGFTADLIIVDEAAFIQDNIFEEILQPMLFATQGRMVLASTPYGMSGYFYDKFNTAESDSRWTRLQVSSYANPLVDEEDLEEFKQGKTSSQIKREVYGEFVPDSDQFFPADATLSCMEGGIPQQESDTCYLGVDIAGSGEDRTVFHGVDELGNVFLNDEAYDEMGVLEAASHIVTLDRQYDFDTIFVDRTAIGEGTVEKLADEPRVSQKIEQVYFSVQKKQQIYQRLKAALESGYLHLPHDKTLRNELDSIGSDTTKSGNLRLYPRGDSDSGRDDFVDSLALAIWGIPKFGGDSGRGQAGGGSPVFGSGRQRIRRPNANSQRNYGQRRNQQNNNVVTKNRPSRDQYRR